MKVNFNTDKTTDSKDESGPILFKSWDELARVCLDSVGINVGKKEAKQIDVSEKGICIVFGDKDKQIPENCPYCNGQREWANYDKKIAECLFCGKKTVV